MREPLLVGQLHRRKTLGNGAQPQALRRHRLLAFHVGRTNDERKPSQPWGVQIVVVNDGLKAAPVPTMITLVLGNLGRVEWNCLLGSSRSQQLIFFYKEKFGGRIDEAA